MTTRQRESAQFVASEMASGEPGFKAFKRWIGVAPGAYRRRVQMTG